MYRYTRTAVKNIVTGKACDGIVTAAAADGVCTARPSSVSLIER